FVVPAMRIDPSDCGWTACTADESLHGSHGNHMVPPPSNVVSRVPSGRYQAIEAHPVDCPPATILSSASRTIELMPSEPQLISVETEPAPAKVTSGEPSGLRRATQYWVRAPPPVPPATIFPSAWMARASAESKTPVTEMAAMPFTPNDRSS